MLVLGDSRVERQRIGLELVLGVSRVLVLGVSRVERQRIDKCLPPSSGV